MLLLKHMKQQMKKNNPKPKPASRALLRRPLGRPSFSSSCKCKEHSDVLEQSGGNTLHDNSTLFFSGTSISGLAGTSQKQWAGWWRHVSFVLCQLSFINHHPHPLENESLLQSRCSQTIHPCLMGELKWAKVSQSEPNLSLSVIRNRDDSFWSFPSEPFDSAPPWLRRHFLFGAGQPAGSCVAFLSESN